MQVKLINIMLKQVLAAGLDQSDTRKDNLKNFVTKYHFLALFFPWINKQYLYNYIYIFFYICLYIHDQVASYISLLVAQRFRHDR